MSGEGFALGPKGKRKGVQTLPDALREGRAQADARATQQGIRPKAARPFGQYFAGFVICSLSPKRPRSVQPGANPVASMGCDRPQISGPRRAMP